MSSHVQTQLTGKARLVCVCHIHNTGQGVASTCSACTNTAERQGVACVYITYTNTGQSVAGTCFHLHVRTQLRGRVWPVCGRHIRTQGRAWPVHVSRMYEHSCKAACGLCMHHTCTNTAVRQSVAWHTAVRQSVACTRIAHVRTEQ